MRRSAQSKQQKNYLNSSSPKNISTKAAVRGGLQGVPLGDATHPPTAERKPFNLIRRTAPINQ